MPKLPRELLWALIISLGIFLVSMWPMEKATQPIPTAGWQQQSSQTTSESAGTSHEILGIKRGEWLLGIATLMLWLATARLVRGADQTAERQLRAYVSVEPTLVFNFGVNSVVMVGVDTHNHGETPAGEISHEFSTGVFQNPLPSDFVFPDPGRRLNTNNSLFPKAKVPVRFAHDRLLTATEVDEIEKDIKRFHIWGTTNYRDAFGHPRTTRISASFGGPDFAKTDANAKAGIFGTNGAPTPGWFWTWGEHHNDAT